MYCKHCGKQIADDNKFCPGCGAKVGAEATTASVGNVFKGISLDHDIAIKFVNVVMACLTILTLIAVFLMPLGKIRPVWMSDFYDVGIFVESDEELIHEFMDVSGVLLYTGIFCFFVTAVFAVKGFGKITLVFSVASMVLMTAAVSGLKKIEGADLTVIKRGSGYIMFMICMVAFILLAFLLNYLKTLKYKAEREAEHQRIEKNRAARASQDQE